MLCIVRIGMNGECGARSKCRGIFGPLHNYTAMCTTNMPSEMARVWCALIRLLGTARRARLRKQATPIAYQCGIMTFGVYILSPPAGRCVLKPRGCLYREKTRTRKIAVMLIAIRENAPTPHKVIARAAFPAITNTFIFGTELVRHD